MILIIKYIGLADKRIIRSADFAMNGINGRDLVWHKGNRWQVQIRTSGPNAERLETMLRSCGHFAISTVSDFGSGLLVAPASTPHVREAPGTILVDSRTGAYTVAK